MDKIRVRKAETGTGPAKTGEMVQLVEEFRRGLPLLRPLDDSPHEFLLYTGCVIREHFQNVDTQVSMNIHGFTSNFWRSSKAVVEAIILNKKNADEKMALYVVMPGAVEDCAKPVMNFVRQCQEFITADYSNVLLALFRQPPTQKMFPSDKQVLGTKLWYIGEYGVDEVRDPYRLYLAGWGMNSGSLDLEIYN
jgi:hypothetical protein